MIAAAFAHGRGKIDQGERAELLGLAQRVLGPVRVLLDHFGAPMLTVAKSRTHIHVAPWARNLVVEGEICDARAARHGLARELEEVRFHGGGVCALLASRWPLNAAPPMIGVVTDGIGMAVSGGHPSALSSAWLIDHVAGRARIDMLLPFGTSAALLFQPVASDARLH